MDVGGGLFDDTSSETTSSPVDVPTDVVHPELAAEAPTPAWVREGGAGGGKAGQDPRALNRKIRHAGRATLAGGSIAILGGAMALTGVILLYAVNPAKRLKDLAKKNGGSLPVDSDKRQRLISIARAGPIVAFTGLGVMVGGMITAGIARWRFGKLREQRRTASVSFGPTMLGQGAEVYWEMRF